MKALPHALATVLAALLVASAAAAGEWPTFAGGPHRLFFNPAETQITAANVTGLRVKWKFHAGAIVTASPSVAVVDLPGEGPTQVVFIQSWDHTLYALRMLNGTEVWRLPFPDYPGGSYPNVASADVSVVGGIQRVYVSSEQTMYSIDAQTGTELWHFDAGTGCVVPPGLCGFSGERNEIESSPLVADGKVFFGNGRQRRPWRQGRHVRGRCRRRPARLVLRSGERQHVPARPGRRHPSLRRLSHRDRARPARGIPLDPGRLRPSAHAERLQPRLVLGGVRRGPRPPLHRLGELRHR